MTVRLSLLLIAAGAAPALAQAPSVLPEYRLRLDPERQILEAQVELDVAATTTIHLLFRVDWDGYPGLAARLGGLEAWGGRGPLPVDAANDDLGAGHYTISVITPDHITISYRLVLTAGGESRYYHRVSQLSADGGHIIGADALPRLWLGEARRGGYSALIWFSGLPGDWRIATVAPRSGTGYEVDDVRGAIFFLGPLRTRQLNLGLRALTIAMYGQWPVSDERVLDAIERIAGALHRIAGAGWSDGKHLVGVGRAPSPERGFATGGQVIGKSGLVYAAGTAPAAIDFARWRHTAAHELTHWYIPTGFRFDGDPPSWFAEGFTDYLALKIQLASGLIEPQEFLNEIGERLNRYRESPLYGVTSVGDAQADFWREDAYRFIYDGGTSAAFLLDLGFQDRGLSLERSLAELRTRTPLTLEAITSTLSGGFRENEWIAAWAANGSNPDWDAELDRYKLVWRDEKLVSLNGWATDALSSIRP